jgi:hypothetical protein
MTEYYEIPFIDGDDENKITYQENIVHGDNNTEKCSTTDIKHKCEACNKYFTTAWNLKRHQEQTEVCNKWLELCPIKTFVAVKDDITNVWSRQKVANMTNWIKETITKKEDYGDVQDATNKVITGSYIQELVLPKGTSCKYCCKTFSSPSSLARHFKSSLICDKWRGFEVLQSITQNEPLH